MEENELNLEELFEVNGGQNAAAELLSEIAEERSCLYEDGTIDFVLCRKLSNHNKRGYHKRDNPLLSTKTHTIFPTTSETRFFPVLQSLGVFDMETAYLPSP